MISTAGRAQLIRSVLHSLPLYYLSLFKLPNYVARKLISTQIKLFWGAKDDLRKLTTVAWHHLEAPKDLGGLGLGSLRLENFGLLLQWWWRFCSTNDALWKRILQSIHNLPHKFLSLPELKEVKHGPLSLIGDIAKKSSWFNQLIQSSFSFVIGNGSNLRFWHDEWVPNTCLKKVFQRLFILSIQKDNTVADMGIWVGDTWFGDFKWRRILFDWEITRVQELIDNSTSISILGLRR